HWSLSSCPAGYQYGMDWRVFVVSSTTGQGAYIPIKDTGPWNIDDNYWDPSSPGYPRPRRLFGDLPRGKPESQAAFYDGYNTVSNCKDLSNNPTGHPGGADQFGRCVLNPSALDLSPAAATTIGLGPGHNDWVDVTFMWEPNVPGYTLDGWGGVHEFNGAPPVSATG